MRESAVETHLRLTAQRLGGEALKFTSPGRRHVADRLVVLPGARVWFVETKAPGAKPRPGQERFLARMSALGCQTLVLDTKAKVDQWAASVGGDPDLWRRLV